MSSTSCRSRCIDISCGLSAFFSRRLSLVSNADNTRVNAVYCFQFCPLASTYITEGIDKEELS